MDSVQQTAIGLEWLIHQAFGLHPQLEAYTTVNQNLEIFPNLNATASEAARLNVLVVGNRGHGCAPGKGGVSKTTRNLHLATDNGLFNFLPLVARPVDDDLTLDEQSQYCLRKQVELDSGAHYLYYGMWVSVTRDDLSINKTLITKVEGEPERVEPWVPDRDNLYPEPIDIPNQGAVTAANTVVRVQGLMRVSLNAKQIDEFVNAVKLLYDGDEGYAIFSEFGLCSAVQRRVDVPSSSGLISFNEAITTRIYTHSVDHKVVYMNTQSLDLDFDVGNAIPLLSRESIPTLQTVPGP